MLFKVRSMLNSFKMAQIESDTESDIANANYFHKRPIILQDLLLGKAGNTRMDHKRMCPLVLEIGLVI